VVCGAGDETWGIEGAAVLDEGGCGDWIGFTISAIAEELWLGEWEKRWRKCSVVGLFECSQLIRAVRSTA
jgi:hypothetical protein